MPSKSKFILKIFFFLLLSSFVLRPSSFVYSEVPRLINYQGRLTDTGGAPLNGSYNLTFRIYDAETAGNLLWEETQNGVIINKGIFAVLLGSVTSLNLSFDKPYFLEVKVANEVMIPRQRITSAGYAIRAEHGVPKGVIVMWSGKIADIPSGWALCDGTNGSPDLRDRFIVGARQDDGGVAKTNVTGGLTKSGDGQIPNHKHGIGTLSIVSAGTHSHELLSICPDGFLQNRDFQFTHGGDPSTSGNRRYTNSTGEHTHALSGDTSEVGSGTKNVAVYYALAFIIKLE